MYSVKLPEKIGSLSSAFKIVLIVLSLLDFGTTVSLANTKINPLMRSVEAASSEAPNKNAIVDSAGKTEKTDASRKSEATDSISGVVQYPKEVATDLPAAYYRFTESSGGSVSDASGNGRNLTLSGTYTRNVAELLLNPASADKAVALSAATASTGTNWLSTSAGVTTSFLVNFSTVPNSGEQVIFESGNFNSPTVGYHKLNYNGSNHQWYFYWNKSNGAGFSSASFAWTPVAGRTYHFAVVSDYAARTVRFYIDGTAVYTVGQTVAPFGLSNQPVAFFSGVSGTTLDELAIFDTALPDVRIRAQFAAARGADASQTIWFASPSGKITGRGTSADPLDVQTAFNFPLVQPSHTLKLKAGSYTGIFNVRLSGASGSRITIKPETSGTVTLNGAGLEGSVLTLSGSYLDASGFEIRKTWSVRESNLVNTSGCPIQGTNGNVGGSGIDDKGNWNRVYYNVIHDVLGDGIASFAASANSEYYGNLIFNNGWYAPRSQSDINAGVKFGNGHGFYTQNAAPSIKNIGRNIIFNPYSSTMKAAGSGDAKIENYNLEGNLAIGGSFYYDIGGGDTGANNINLARERTFNVSVALGYNTSAGRTVSLTDSYIYGGSLPLQVQNFNSIVLTGNTVIGSGGNSGGIIQATVKTAYGNSTVNNNTYYHNRPQTANQFFANNVQGYASATNTFAEWKSATGWDASSTYVANGTAPTKPVVNRVFVEAMNAYEAGRGYVAVYNWSGASTQSVDLSSILANGQSYEIRSVSNYYAGAVVSGTFSNASPTVVLPLTLAAGLPAQALPYGDIARGSDPIGKFAAFLIVPTSPVKTSRELCPGSKIKKLGCSLPPVNSPPLSNGDSASRRVPAATIFNQADGLWHLFDSESGYTNFRFGISSDKPVAADFDGDGKTDIAVWRESTETEAVFYILESSTHSVRTEKFGQPGDIPSVVGDWDGDAKADVAVYRDAAPDGQSYFLYRGSLNNPNGDVTYIPWGTNRDVPQSGDFDGDGKRDAAVFRPSNDTWYILQSSTGQIDFRQFGTSTDTFMPADYDGDGKTDLAIYRNGVWYLEQTREGSATIRFGFDGGTPAGDDFDGDGKADLAVYKDGVWYLQPSKKGFDAVKFNPSK